MKIYSRTEWGAKYRDGVADRSAFVGRLDKWAHHTVTAQLSEGATVAQEMAQMRAIEAVGQSRFGAGMSYTFLVFPSGRVYQGVSISRLSYHTGQGRNANSVAICYPGNYETHQPTKSQLDATAELLRYGEEKKWWTQRKIDGGHRDLKATACPGRNYYGKIGAINLAAAGTAKVPPVSSVKPTSNPITKIKLPRSHTDKAGVAAYVKALGYSSVKAYQAGQHYYPGLRVDGSWGPLTQAHAEWVATLQTALNQWKAVIRLGRTKVDGDFGPFGIRCVDAVIASNFNGAYTKLVKSLYGASARPVNDKTPGKAVCKMLGIPAHPMTK
ncbi:peptidoglycan recognition protein family protein [Flaviflexus equikiangi]|uniref:N-acetylmuramoyl-L-alanine amidase n=1 Tax=Flaviflexus equikiangi TaxID=2758573 RepID=A0ABS2TCH4_9ACTO|nr:N-acetylmuramoyl-L-alanine amidase [Flaviflexus equikiangi]MBM9432327.1 N-acetylmuramoyl-L-alanine amidase [Flaviflexus equikiangi]